MATARWDAYRERAEVGAAKGARRNSSLDAWEWIVERQTELAGDIEKGRSSTEAANFVDRALSARPERGSSDGEGGLHLHAHLDSAAVGQLLAVIGSHSATVIDGEGE
jgi:hypothetical protein